METLWAQKNRESRCLKVPGSSYNAKEYFDQGKPVSFLVPKIGKLLINKRHTLTTEHPGPEKPEILGKLLSVHYCITL